MVEGKRRGKEGMLDEGVGNEEKGCSWKRRKGKEGNATEDDKEKRKMRRRRR